MKKSPLKAAPKRLNPAVQIPILLRRTENHDQHIKWLLNTVKALQREQLADKDEIKRLRKRVEGMDSE